MERAKDPGESATERITGYDLARSLALLGMIVIHFTLVAAADRLGDSLLAAVVHRLDGRPAALFVILAGIGITLMSRRAVASSQQPGCSAAAGLFKPAARRTPSLAQVQTTLVRRGIFLLAIGYLNLLIWQGDILRVYGVSLILASQLLTATGRQLLTLAAGFVIGFMILMTLVDFNQNWNWETLTYQNLWAPENILRNLLYDSFRGVFPWTGFILYGMWLGRLDLLNPKINRRVFAAGVIVAVVAEVTSQLLMGIVLSQGWMNAEDAQAILGTNSMPSLPLFLLSAGGTATAVIAACIYAAAIVPSRFIWPLVATGQMALTWYFAHIVIGLGLLERLGMEGTETTPVAVGLGLLFFAAAVGLSCLWKASFRHGPLEWVMRKAAG